jgi:TRAP-type C4-dicarboxylate transport system permease small subunit
MSASDPSQDPDVEAFGLDDDDPPFRWSEFGPEDYVVLIVFWLLAADVFAQFFSRFVLGDSIGWTEEMARYLLIAVGFLGGAMAVRRNSHIMMEFMYRYMSERAETVMRMLIDVGRVAFFAVVGWLTFEMAGRTNSFMASVDIPKSVIYYVACAGFALMTLRAVHRIVTTWPGHLARLLPGAAGLDASQRTEEP